MFTLWPFILMSYFHFLNFSSSKAFVSANRTYYRQHQVVPGTNLSWFLYSIDEASRTITNRTNSRGLRTEPWCTPTPTPKISLPLTFTLIVVSSYYTYYTLLFSLSLSSHSRPYISVPTKGTWGTYPITRSRGNSHTLSPYPQKPFTKSLFFDTKVFLLP